MRFRGLAGGSVHCCGTHGHLCWLALVGIQETDGPGLPALHVASGASGKHPWLSQLAHLRSSSWVTTSLMADWWWKQRQQVGNSSPFSCSSATWVRWEAVKSEDRCTVSWLHGRWGNTGQHVPCCQHLPFQMLLPGICKLALLSPCCRCPMLLWDRRHLYFHASHGHLTIFLPCRFIC